MSGTKRVLLAVAMLGLGVRCIYVPVGVHRRPAPVVVAPPPAPPPGRPVPPPPPAPPPGQPVPPPPPRMLTQGEAVNIGLQYCHSRALPCDLQEAHLTGNGIWKVKFKVRGHGEKGHVHLELDGVSGAVLKVDQKVKERGGRGHDDD